ncbi:MAG: hypothetical protein ACR2GN_07530 [Bacteroidia bacterium]
MKNLIFTLLFIFSGLIAFTQPGEKKFEERKEKIEALKVAFITKELNLTTEEAKSFWPVYNKFEEEMHTLRKSRRSERREMKAEIENMGDKEAEQFVNNEIAFRQNELDIIKKYHPQFKQVLPVKKVALLIRAEEDFKRELLRKIQAPGPERRQGR